MKNWIASLEYAIIGMVVLRLLSGLFEMTAAFIMLKFNNVEKALQVNALLALVGPIILIVTMTIGLVGVSDKLPFSKLIIVGLGVFLIIFGLKR
ncbi:YqhV family protein [Evansella sp. AB-P1]|uniref:YqhV family protein n=1 Tax=Evansella sp. AB-P1 TaxID=3037653 RepID=UPI00241EF3BB|nr:YqhV family protein [Evansella sp. AB-P1]MDG5789340.1 YqhV family protein [Evansella sp. AB-P1]